MLDPRLRPVGFAMSAAAADDDLPPPADHAVVQATAWYGPQHVGGTEVYVEARTVDVHIGRLRKALIANGERDPIRTVRSAGYSLDEHLKATG